MIVAPALAKIPPEFAGPVREGLRGLLLRGVTARELTDLYLVVAMKEFDNNKPRAAAALGLSLKTVYLHLDRLRGVAADPEPPAVGPDPSEGRFDTPAMAEAVGHYHREIGRVSAQEARRAG